MATSYTRESLKQLSLSALTELSNHPNGATMSQALVSLSQAIDEEVSIRYAYANIEDAPDAELLKLYDDLGKGRFTAQPMPIKVLEDRYSDNDGAKLKAMSDVDLERGLGTFQNHLGVRALFLDEIARRKAGGSQTTPGEAAQGLPGSLPDAGSPSISQLSTVGGTLGTIGTVTTGLGVVTNLTGNEKLTDALKVVGTVATVAGTAVGVASVVSNLLKPPEVPQLPEIPKVPEIPAGSNLVSSGTTVNPAGVTATTVSGTSPVSGSNPVSGTTSASTSANDPYATSAEEETEEQPLDRVNCAFAWQNPDADLPNCTVFELELAEELSKPYLLRLRVTGAGPDVDESAMVGEACTLTVIRGNQRYINGIVSEASFTTLAHDGTSDENLPLAMLHLTVVPALALMTQRRDNRIFQNMSVPDILKAVLTEGLSDFGRTVALDLQNEYPVLEYCTQYDETDLAFVQRLMAQEGIVSVFVQGETAEELKLIDDVSSYAPVPTYNNKAVPLKTTKNDHDTVEVIDRFLTDTRLTPTSAGTRVFNWSNANPPTDHTVDGKDAAGNVRQQYLGEAPATLHGYEGVQYGNDTAQAQAKLVQETALSRGKTGRGTGIVTGMTAGGVFTLENALRQPLNRGYVLTKVVHRGRAVTGGAYLGVVGRKVPPLCDECPTPDKCKAAEKCVSGYEISYSNSFECVPDDVLFRMDRPPRRFVQTAQTAVVVGVEGEDITTDEYGRIKVQFHWDRSGTTNEETSCWMRVAQPSAGIGFGNVFIPRAGMEVIVTFLEGNPDKPVVTGCVYNGINLPKELPAKKTRSVIRTWSTPSNGGFNELSFEDAAGSEEVYMQAQKNLKILVKNDKDQEVDGNETLLVKKDRTREITGNQKLKVGKNDFNHIVGNHTMNVDGNETVHVGGLENVLIDKAAVRTVGLGQATTVGLADLLTVGAEQITTVAGEQRINVGLLYNLTVGNKKIEQVAKDSSEAVGGSKQSVIDKSYKLDVHESYALIVGKDRDERVTGSLFVDVTKDSTELVAEKKVIEAKKDLSLSGKKIILSAEDELSITVGSAVLVMKKNGDVLLNGNKVTIKGDGDVVVKGKKISNN
ncbi:MAG: type VI secretion system tip protein VgrG [Archangium sp.]|nr:type VI secretion system tip protein VgrG [Archangium sp.]